MPRKLVITKNQTKIDHFFKSTKTDLSQTICSQFSSPPSTPLTQKRRSLNLAGGSIKKQPKLEHKQPVQCEPDIETILFNELVTSTQNSTQQTCGTPDKVKLVTTNSSGASKYAGFQTQTVIPDSPKRISDNSTGTMNGTRCQTLPQTPPKRPPSAAEMSPRSLKSSPSKKSPFSPKKRCSRNLKFDSPRKFQLKFVDQEKLYNALTNMNYVRERFKESHTFDLEKIYAANSYEYKYEHLDSKSRIKYDIGDIVIPRETYADYMVTIICEVFSNSINCEYFTKEELDKVYTYLCLKAGAQILLTKLMKRKRTLYRFKTIINIDNEIKQFLPDLIESKFLNPDLSDYSMEELLNLLQEKEVKEICKLYKTDKSSKEKGIKGLLKIYSKKASLFGGISPAQKLRQDVIKMLGRCVCISEDVQNLFDRIFTLFMPSEYLMQSQKNSQNTVVADLFHLMFEFESGNIEFYSLPEERYPVFRNREHLMTYIECALLYLKAGHASEQKDWNVVVDLTKMAYEKFNLILTSIDDGSQQEYLPAHVRRFLPGHVLAKIVWLGIGALKKNKGLLGTAEDYLTTLLSQHYYAQKYRGKWYSELALIQSYHNKQHNTSVEVIIRGLNDTSINEVDAVTMLEKLKAHAKRKNGIDASTREIIKSKLTADVVSEETFASVTIGGNKLERFEMTKGKSMWSVVDSDQKIKYVTVEDVAKHYYVRCNFTNALHCEGSLPILLFSLVYWDELYNVSVPGAFLSAYQNVPLDLFSPNFMLQRHSEITNRQKIIDEFESSTFVEYVTGNYVKYNKYRTLMPNNLFSSDDQLKGVIECLGKDAVMKICQKLLEDFRLWRSGFPDLIVWNEHQKIYKIVEVKGPGDTLSVKQKLWIKYLQKCAICTELCHVKDNSNCSQNVIEIVQCEV